ncbi:MAG: hypothetical protein MSL26_05350 [Clostridiales bacterium]|nr:hypothetical protein [Clostridiales bacterium]
MTKRVYEKPVYIAQTYVTASSIAAGCEAKPGSIEGKTKEMQLWWGLNICAGNKNDGHCIGGQNGGKGAVGDYWGTVYAGGTGDPSTSQAFLFDSTNTVCDFIWSGGDDIGAWTDGKSSDTLQANAAQRQSGWMKTIFTEGFMQFFYGNSCSHLPGYQGAKLMYS